MKTYLSLIFAILSTANLYADNCQGQVRVQLQAAHVVQQPQVVLQQVVPYVVQQPQVVLQQTVPYVVQQPQVVLQQAQAVHAQVVTPFPVQQRVLVQAAPVVKQQLSVRQVAPVFQRGLLRGLLTPPNRQTVVIRSTTH